MFDSTWPPEDMPASPDYLVALGALSLFYNEMEMALWTFFKTYIANERVRNFLFEELHNRNRVDLIKALLDDEPNPAFRAEAEHGLKCFDRITENRNVMLHSFAFAYENEPMLAKRNRSKSGLLSAYSVPLEVVQANALAASNTKWFFFGLSKYREDALGWIADDIEPQPVPPSRPLPPNTLSLFRPLGDHEAD